MEITDEMREHARASYGPAMPDFLAALQRMRGSDETDMPEVVAAFTHGDEAVAQVTVERWHGVVRPAVYAYVSGEGQQLEVAQALRSGWDLIAAADAVRFGWIS